MAGKITKMLVHFPEGLKQRLDAKRSQGYSLSGYVRSLLERDLTPSASKGKKGA